jgi:hypothetical protein
MAVALVHFNCTCGRRLKARQEDAGEEIECPDCGRTLRIPVHDIDQAPPVAEPGLRAPAETFLSQTVTPWPDAETRRRGADGPDPRDEKVGSGLSVLVLVLVLAAGLGAWWYFVPSMRDAVRAQEPRAVEAPGRADFDELKHVPDGALAVVALRPGALPPPKFGAKMSVAQLVLTRMATQLGRLGPVERTTWVVMAADRRLDAAAGAPGHEVDAWVVVRMADAYDQNAALKMFIPFPAVDLQKRKYAGRVYFAGVARATQQKGPPPMGKGPPPMGKGPRPKGKGPAPMGKGPAQVPPSVRLPALFLLNERVFVLSDTVAIKRFLRDAPQKSREGPLDEALNLAAQGKGLVIGLSQTGFALKERQPVKPDDTAAALLSALKLFTAAAVAVDAPADAQEKGGTETTLDFHFMTPQAARAAQKAVLAWRAGQEKRRQEILAKQYGRAVHARLALVAATLGSVTPGRMCPVAPLPLSAMPELLAGSGQGAAELERLKTEEAFLKGLTPPRLSETKLHMALVAPPQFAALANQFWGAFAERALNSTPGPRPDAPPPIGMPKPGGPKGFGK